jgi:hypothetical protein
MTEWRDQLPAAERKAMQRNKVPEWTSPMLATLTNKRFSSPDWLYESKSCPIAPELDDAGNSVHGATPKLLHEEPA